MKLQELLKPFEGEVQYKPTPWEEYIGYYDRPSNEYITHCLESHEPLRELAALVPELVEELNKFCTKEVSHSQCYATLPSGEILGLPSTVAVQNPIAKKAQAVMDKVGGGVRWKGAYILNGQSQTNTKPLCERKGLENGSYITDVEVNPRR